MAGSLKGKKAGAAFIILACFICGSFLFAEKGPKIKFKEESWNFGPTKQGEVLTHVFEFTNVGDSPLVIKEVKTSCGCTAALISAKKIEPGQKGEIKISLNTTGYAGEVTKYAYVESNDPSQPTQQLIVQASVDVPPRPVIELDSYSQDLGLILEDEDIKARVRIKNKGELELSVTPSHKDAEFFQGKEKISFPIRIPAGKEEGVEVRIPSQDRKQLLREYILLRSNDPLRPNLSLYLTGYVVTKKQLRELFQKYSEIIK